MVYVLVTVQNVVKLYIYEDYIYNTTHEIFGYENVASVGIVCKLNFIGQVHFIIPIFVWIDAKRGVTNKSTRP